VNSATFAPICNSADVYRRTDTLTESERLEAAFALSTAWKAHGIIPEWSGNGRPRKFPAVFALYYELFAGIHGTSSAVDRELAEPTKWKLIRLLWDRYVAPQIAETFGGEPIVLPESPYREYHYKYIANTYLTDPVIRARLDDLLAEDGVDKAIECGGFDPSIDSWTKPATTNAVIGDATTLRPLAGRKTKLADPDAHLYHHGGRHRDKESDEQDETDQPEEEAETKDVKDNKSEKVYGVQHLLAGTHIPDLGGNIILGTQPVTRPGQEMAATTQVLDRVIHRVHNRAGNSAVRVYLHDKAMRGTHINEYQNQFGIIAAAKKSKGTPASDNQPSIPFDTWDGYHIRAEQGRPFAYEHDVNGNLIKTQEQPRKTQVKRRLSNREQTWRIHAGYEFHGTTHWLRTWNVDSDHYSRAENIRAIDEQTLHQLGFAGLRGNIENTNRQAKRNLPDGRARTRGAARQHINIIGWSLQRNAEALWRYRRDHDLPLNQAA